MRKNSEVLEKRKEYIKERCSTVRNKPAEFERIANELFLSKDLIKKEYYG